MLEPDGSPNTAHSLNPVPLVSRRDDVRLRDGRRPGRRRADGLALLGLDQPPA
jgi:2,3-bisphosphoglycerate-independent phosphoglycerate mutase